MRRRAGVLGLVIAVLAVLWWWHGSRETAAPEVASKGAVTVASHGTHEQPKTATLGGRVTRAKDGAPIEGATIAIEQQRATYFGPPAVFVSSDKNGAWTTPLGAGEYKVGVVADGFLPISRSHVVVTASTSLDLALVDGGIVVHGVVSDVGGGPVAGARVSTFKDSVRVATFTHADGSYRFTLEPDEYRLLAEHDDYASSNAEVYLATGSVVQDFALVPCGSIRGTVVARDSGKPIPDVLVTLGVYAWNESSAAKTDASGSFTLHHVPPGRASLYARSTHYVTYNGTDVNVGIGETATARLVVDPGYSIRGRVVRAGQPTTGIEHVDVSAHTEGAAPDNHVLHETSADGVFEIIGLAPAVYQLTATGNSIHHATQIVKLDHDLEGIVLNATSGTTLSGRLDPPTKAALSFSSTGFRNESIPTWEISAEVSDDGTFIARNVPPGDLTAYAKTRDRSGKLDVKVGASAQSGLVIQLTPASHLTVSGTVVDDQGPVANATVVGEMDMTMTATDGTFSLTASGTTPLRAGCAHNDPAFGRAPLATVDVHTNVRDIVLHIAPCRDQITGRVVGTNGTPRPDVWVRVPSEAPVLTGADGTFTIRGLRAGTYDVTATSSRGDETVTTNSVRTGDQITLALQEIPTLHGSVTMNGQPVSDFEVTCDRAQRHVTSTDGKFEIAHYVSEDPRVATCQAAASVGEGSASITTANSSLVVSIALQPFVSVHGTLLSALTKRPVTNVAIAAESGVAAGLNRAGAPYPVDDNGRFQIDQLTAGEHRLRVVPIDGWGYLAMLQVHATVGTTIDLGAIFIIPPVEGHIGSIGIYADSNMVVRNVMPGSPADRSGVRVGDKIVKLDGINISDLDSGAALGLLSNVAPYGETLALELGRGVTVNVTAE